MKCECTGIAKRADRGTVGGNLMLGLQGWNHAELSGRVYDTAVGSLDRLREYGRSFSTVEVDDTFYGLPPEPLVEQWRDCVPPRFTFSLKAPQQITHVQRFDSSGGLLERFLERVSRLGPKLGGILLVTPLGFKPDHDTVPTLRRFVEELPTDFSWAIEVKHRGWFTDEIHSMLADNNVALAVGDDRWVPGAASLALAERPTADFAYFRWSRRPISPPFAEQSGGTAESMDEWEDLLVRLSGRVGSVYGYFHVRANGDGLRSATRVGRSVGGSGLEASVHVDQDAR